jgi:tRNA 2-thiouridine synthesizing protein A
VSNVGGKVADNSTVKQNVTINEKKTNVQNEKNYSKADLTLPNGNTIQVTNRGGKTVMAFDLRGLKCPHPTLTLTSRLVLLRDCTTLELKADCVTFQSDIKKWCERLKKTIVALHEKEDFGKRYIYCQIAMKELAH